MIDKVFRCYVEKRPGYDIASESLKNELSEVLGLPKLKVRLFNRYDIQNLAQADWPSVLNTVLSEAMCDNCFEENLPPLSDGTRILFVESLPGQFDLRADSCEQCIQMLIGGIRPIVQTAMVYAFEGLDASSFDRVRSYMINPVECREASEDKPASLVRGTSLPPADIPVLSGYAALDAQGLDTLRLSLGLAMSIPDMLVIKDYFLAVGRDPTLAELRVLDTYWSDHCRHTTFNTIIESTTILDSRISEAFDNFLSINGDRPVSLMSIATAAMRHLNKSGKLPMLDQSDEINACTIRVNVDFPHGQEDWLLFFKNETHNHPTEIEPFGGAATCIGGAIRDPLSGRSYVYQSMRISGSGDPRKPIGDTLPGKLPQRKITTSAAQGFSSYGNQIGLATGYVKELYHEGYIAKRMEVGAVVGAAPLSQIKREKPLPGDIVALLGGRTGRDGIGGATGSSKTHDADTVSERGSEVQKGNAPEERKLQRLFRNPEATKLIKKCNDFGAGGASVAIGELAQGVEIELDALPVKYDGLDGVELAISESQERMAVVVAPQDFNKLKSLAEAENIETSLVARVTENEDLVMLWRGNKIVDISREFLDKNGAERTTSVFVGELGKGIHGTATADGSILNESLSEANYVWDMLLSLCGDLNFCSQKGLVERFDHSIGAATVLNPYGGKTALAETQIMAALLPAAAAKTASVMAYAYDPYITQADPFGGSAYAVVSSVAKLVASAVPLDTIHLSLQEYFPRLGEDPVRWGLPFSAILGAFSAQMGLGIAAIGGKDSMSGSFEELDVPPTLISFAVGLAEASRLISPEFKGIGNPVYLLETPLEIRNENAESRSSAQDKVGMRQEAATAIDATAIDRLPDYESLLEAWGKYADLCRAGTVLSAWVCEKGGAYGGIMKMALGNMIGFSGEADADLFEHLWASIVFESNEALEGYRLLGYTQAEPALSIGRETIALEELREAWEAPLESIFPTKTQQAGTAPLISNDRRAAPYRGVSFAQPRAVIPVFPGTNCEYDTIAAIERAGGIAEVVMIRNLTPDMLQSSIIELENAISSAQMIVFPGGFSGGDEPDGSGKFIVSLFRNERLSDAVHELLDNRDGLILGICNGFQALIKLGLVPFGRIMPLTADCPTLTFNQIGRHQARYVHTRVSSVLSPWLFKCNPDEIYVQPISHGEGRLIASEDTLEDLRTKGQIVFQYTNSEGLPSMDINHNPNGSSWAIEGLSSPDGRILGKMAHPERYGEYVAKNIPGNKYLPIFEGGVGYFK